VQDKKVNKIQTPRNEVFPAKAFKETIGNAEFYTYWPVSQTANFGIDVNGNTSFFRVDIPRAGVKKIVAPYTVPKGHSLAIGDNRDGSSDSRFWGPVPKINIKGTPMIIWLSTHNWIPRVNRFFNIFHGK